MMHQESFTDLISQAAHMLADRTKAERDLIYYIAKMDDEEKAAIIIAYENILPQWNKKRITKKIE